MPLTIDILYVNQESLTVKGEEVPHFVDATRRVTEAASQTFAVEPPTYRDFLIKGEAYLVVVRRLSRSPKNGEYSTQPTDVLVSIPQRSLRESQGAYSRLLKAYHQRLDDPNGSFRRIQRAGYRG
ncbi:hypothetical protein A2631_05800 [Candidatus Daviesbacteria bacterium RIFCSPHIGHO2_01_FULL_44_29]|uniref:Uncharacterized protein n=1 Tax=Candidatus Daviesbacteria bacterium RIFCSPHIGHO2_02_FULL_43_12 TaxID=1797776 RepID=A0A1F5KIH1_9BACT|nr:MAG: hypothetical protein A2631_05800 [Candidatus Daviesbacteria bacterium RIFCSPHIGHO2_01_FULL_44_29]OGE39474.1 MAG: hypothetical protein A3E86_03960 [Candidatus Daviesbacteria bacterium RIFCSPHIGHO2_12_FULL_47_45]OGE40634.1 MAG: hypothetical protein A3D25_05750 [Candidatus Daviesbacteria bacterium RIFCSPHIGHO2_02_FULL_43_12]OGE69869.1 MAG: hypothetical protein A3B55_05675 [Candidatus Daviesbacteria bacterium RIFCSPLOWO2_01_FULL_43_15]